MNSHHNDERLWIDSEGKGGWKVPCGKGHASDVKGWVEGEELVFTSSTDYHNEINSEHYIKWLTEQFLPSLNEPSVIILDNAPHHNKQKDKPPSTSDRKDTIRQWLTNHNIPYNMTDIKKTLLDCVKHHQPEPFYLTDKVIQEHGCTVSKLPVAHC